MPPDDKGQDSGDDKGKSPDDKGDKGQPDVLEGLLSELDKKLQPIAGLGDKVGKLEQTVNLIQSNLLDPDFVDKGTGKKTDAKPVDKGEGRKSFNEVDWDNMDNREVALTIVQELNDVLRDAQEGVDKRSKDLEDRLEAVVSELDIAQTIMTISEEEECSLKEARTKFSAVLDEMEKLSEEFPTISAQRAYKIATGTAKKPAKGEGGEEGSEDKGEGREGLVKSLVKELRGGGGKPGGAEGLDAKVPKATRDVVSSKYDEIFSGEGT